VATLNGLLIFDLEFLGRRQAAGETGGAPK
jgi:hypothetical protein